MTLVCSFCRWSVSEEEGHCKLGAITESQSLAKDKRGASMLLNLYLLVSKDLSGTGMLAVGFAGVLGTLLICDARGSRQNLNGQTRERRTNSAR